MLLIRMMGMLLIRMMGIMRMRMTACRKSLHYTMTMIHQASSIWHACTSWRINI